MILRWELPLFSDGDPKKRHRFDLRLDYSTKDAHLHILYRLELDLISDQDPKFMDACLRIFIRLVILGLELDLISDQNPKSMDACLRMFMNGDIRGPRYLHLKKVYFFVGHPVGLF